MENRFVLQGERRDWAPNELPMLVNGNERIIDLSYETHDRIIRSQYDAYLNGQSEASKEGDYTFKSGKYEWIRLFNQNNQYNFPQPSLSDLHAWQLQELMKKLGIKIKNYATVGTGPSADQVLNAFFLIPDEDVKIHVFEADREKVAGAKYLLKKLGLEYAIGGKIQFHEGNVIEELPKEAKRIGGFELIDLQLFAMHLIGDDFGKFWEASVASLNPGGFIKNNELMLGQFGMQAHVDDPPVQSLKTTAENYLIGDGTLAKPSFLNVGWRWRKAHAWNSSDELIGDIGTLIGSVLLRRPELEMSLGRQNVGWKHSYLLGMRYLPPLIAAAVSAKAAILEEMKAKEADDFKALAKWAWREGERFDKILTSPEFQRGDLSIRFPECSEIILQKA